MTKYKGFTIETIEWWYGQEKRFCYEIHKIDENKRIIYYKDNGVTPYTATLSDSQFDTIEEAKQAIDDNKLIVGGAFIEHNGHLGYFQAKVKGKIWHCDLCDKDHFCEKVEPYADSEEYGLLCESCFKHLINGGRKLHFILSPDNYDYKIKE